MLIQAKGLKMGRKRDKINLDEIQA